jgi:hypothetical protein
MIGCACSRAQSGATATSAQASAANPAAGNAESSAENVVAAGAASVIAIHGRIASVDQEEKLVTLQAAGGKQLTLHILIPFKLAAVKPGEPFLAKFYEIASVQKLAPGQAPTAQSLTAGIVGAAPDQTSVAALGSQYQFEVTIDAIDKNNKTLSIKGSDGVVEVVDVANPESLEQVQVGEQVVVTLIDVVAVALDKEGSSANAAPQFEP